MIKIRPVSELRNSFPKIEDLVINQDETVYLTKNGTGIMVVMSIEKYSSLINSVDETQIISSKKSSRRTSKKSTPSE
ncbi:MAG: type II toxin-antitoxin system Phd/YefM family antitoxin [Oscillospiraceae bacterium]|nr:type II toxin-antitoxin system Phd/YefM family antitoxin [Oscillospiraceae bacterium]